LLEFFEQVGHAINKMCFRRCFLNISISEDDVATSVTCGSNFCKHIIANFLLSLSAKELTRNLAVTRVGQPYCLYPKASVRLPFTEKCDFQK